MITHPCARTSSLAISSGVGAWFTLRPTQTAPDVTFTTLEGKTFSMQDLRGKVVLVKFWATSCVTCVKQMPETISAYNEYAGKGYGALKTDLAEIVTDWVTPFRDRTREFMDDPAALDKILFEGAEKARTVASETLRDVYDKVGLVPGRR